MQEVLRIGVIGLGAQGAQHMSGLAQIEGVRLAALVDLDAELAARVAQASGVPAFSDLDVFFRAGTEIVDAVIVCVPNRHHCDTVLQALSAGLHALVEKPMAISLAECDRMIAAAHAADLRLMVSHNLLFYEPHRVVRDLIASGAIRRPHLFRTRLTCGNMYGGWRDRAELCGGGLLIDSGAHRFYTARQMMGEVKTVSAWLDTDDPRRRGDETGFVVMEFEAGGVGLIDSTFHAPGGDLRRSRRAGLARCDDLDSGQRGGVPEELVASAGGERRRSDDQSQRHGMGGAPDAARRLGLELCEVRRALRRVHPRPGRAHHLRTRRPPQPRGAGGRLPLRHGAPSGVLERGGMTGSGTPDTPLTTGCPWIPVSTGMTAHILECRDVRASDPRTKSLPGPRESMPRERSCGRLRPGGTRVEQRESRYVAWRLSGRWSTDPIPTPIPGGTGGPG